MNTNLTYLLIGLGLLVCVILVGVIVRQLRAQKQREAEQAAHAEKVADDAQKHRRYLIDSIKLVAGAVLNDENMTLTEGCIRIKVLLDNLAPHLLKQPEFAVIDTVYGKTEHIPFLEQWKALPDDDKRKYLEEMESVEADHRPDVNEAMRQLQSYPLDQMQ